MLAKRERRLLADYKEKMRFRFKYLNHIDMNGIDG